jgi:MinD-like ATPase involved in chromosome partitioning or flagellar assembly
VRARRPLVDSDPRSDAAVYLARIARKLIAPRIDAAGETASFAQRAQVSRSEPQASEDHKVGERRPSGESA